MTEILNITNALRVIAQLSIDRSSVVLGKLIKRGARIEIVKVYSSDISEASSAVYLGDEGVVGAILNLEGDINLKFLFFVTHKDSLLITDMILRKELGTTKQFDLYAESAIQEIGNIVASAITNVFTSDFGINMKPTPPIIINDFAGTVFEEYIREIATVKNQILIIETKFQVVRSDISCYMFMLPIPGSEEHLANIDKLVGNNGNNKGEV